MIMAGFPTADTRSGTERKDGRVDFCDDCYSPAVWMAIRATQLLLFGAVLWTAYQIVRRIRR
jgi:hypothetical protein